MPQCPRPRARRPLLAAVLALTLPPRAALAQQKFDMNASLALTETYDDNVFAVPDDRRQDVVSRLSPRLGVAYRSPRLGLRARYERDLENFRRHPELRTLGARQEGLVDADWSPGAGFEIAAAASYAQTHTPGEFDVISGLEITGLELRRSPARRLSTTQSLSRRLGPRMRAILEHAFTRDDIAGGPTTATRVAGARLERQVGPLDTVALSYGRRRFAADGEGTTSHTLALAWARDVTPRVRLEIKAGPRLSAGTVGPELAAALTTRLRRGGASLSYVQTETALIGHPAPVRAEGVTVAFNHAFRRGLTVSASPSLFRARAEGSEVTVYGMGLDVAWRLGRHLTLAASQRLSLQHGALGGRPRGEIAHNIVRLTLVAGSVD